MCLCKGLSCVSALGPLADLQLRKSTPVDQWANPVTSTKLKPQIFGTSKPGRGRDIIGRGNAGLRQDAGLLQPLPENPFKRRQAGQEAKAALKGALAHTGLVGKGTDRMRVLKAGVNVVED